MNTLLAAAAYNYRGLLRKIKEVFKNKLFIFNLNLYPVSISSKASHALSIPLI
jgi:hypothetical protein